MRKSGNKIKRTVSGYLGFFFMVAITCTASVLILEAVRSKIGNDTSTLAFVMLVVCFGLSLCCTTFDALRRKFTEESAFEQILDATDRITEGDFTVRLIPRHPYGKYDDLDMVMDNLNKMAEELSKNELLKSDFISNVSHEIKTPLAIIQSYATILANESLDEESRKNYLRTISDASKRLSTLVVNILQLNKLENQSVPMEKKTVNLEESLSEVIFGFEDLLVNKNLDLECDFDEVRLFTAPALIEIVWNNLLSNAIKFTPENGKIFISLKGDSQKATILFKDSGLGMNEKTGKHIFDKFYQGDTSHSKEGNGLGLALVKRVIDMLDGKITVESELGKGTSFTVTLRSLDNEE